MSVTPAPADVELEGEVVGSMLSFYATCTLLRPEHCYRPANALVLSCWLRLGRPAGRVRVLKDGTERLAPFLEFPGLHDTLEARNPGRGRRLAIYAGLLAARAPVATRADVARLRLLAGQRHRLRALESERQRLLS